MAGHARPGPHSLAPRCPATPVATPLVTPGAELLEPQPLHVLLVEPEEVPDLVQDRDLDLLAERVLVGEAGEQVGVEQDDAGGCAVDLAAALAEVVGALEQAEGAGVEAF